MIFSPGVLASIAAAMAIATIFMPPAATFVRSVRPYVSLLSLSAMVLSHLSGSQVSLWSLLTDTANYITSSMEQFASQSSLFMSLPWLWAILLDAMAFLMLSASFRALYCLSQFSLKEWKDLITQWAFDWARNNIPKVQKDLKSFREQTKRDLVHIVKKDPNHLKTDRLPLEGVPAETLMKQLDREGESDCENWRRGQISGTIYPVTKAHSELMKAAFSNYAFANPLHPGVWPSILQMEAEIVSMTANLLGNGETSDNVVGVTTSGGTESILLGIRAHLILYGKQRSITHPELICGSTAHVAVDKACEIYGIRKVVVDVDTDTYAMNAKEVEKHVTSNTIMIYSSAPSYMHGIIDPIDKLSDVAKRYNIGLHVDACLGGFFLPFARQLGYDIPPFDFACPGVTSMSADLHKYGYGAMTRSVVLYRNDDLRQAQYFAYPKFSGGLYATPTIAGSRPGSLLACAWATMMSIGQSGYQERVRGVMEAVAEMVEGISKLEDVELCGKQQRTLSVAFTSKTLDIYRIGDYMKEKGWSINAMQTPPCLDFIMTLNTAPKVGQFLSDLQTSLQETRKEGATGKSLGTAKIYGAVGKMPTGPAGEMLKAFTDMTLTV